MDDDMDDMDDEVIDYAKLEMEINDALSLCQEIRDRLVSVRNKVIQRQLMKGV